MSEHTNDNQERIVEDAVRQFVDAQMAGREPDIDGLVRQYPDCADQIRQVIANIRQVDALFDSLTQAESSDCEAIDGIHNLVGERIARFHVTDIIGRGGMGVVYLAQDTKLNRSVAVKCIQTGLPADTTARVRFRREAKLLASLNHPNIAAIYEIIEQEEDSDYLILEYVPGETLAERLARDRLALDEILSIGLQVAEAISAAHKKGIVHRDLKPGNIKITPEGRIKVLDFGLAKALAGEGKESEVTATQVGHVVGTPAYMSPEQARGAPTDYRTDIWAFGCLLYQMLTSHLPFEGDSAPEILARVIERNPDWRLLPHHMPSNIRTLVRQCLEKDPDQRLEDIDTASREIHKIQARSSGQGTKSGTSGRKTAIIATLLVLGCGAVFVGTTLRRRTPPSSQSKTDDSLAASRPTSVPRQGLVAHWTMDNVDGMTIPDSSGNGHHGTVRPGMPIFVDGPIGLGKALYTNGENPSKRCIYCGRWNPSEKIGQLSIALWVKWDGPNGKGQVLVSKRDEYEVDKMMWQLSIHPNEHWVMLVQCGSQNWNGDIILQQGQWTHVAVTFDGTTKIVYFDGQEVGRGVFSFGTKINATISIGGADFNEEGGWRSYDVFHGALDDIRLYDRTLTPQEVYALSAKAEYQPEHLAQQELTAQ